MEGRLYEPRDFITRATKELYRGELHNSVAFVQTCIQCYGNKEETLKRFAERARDYGCKMSDIYLVIKRVEEYGK